MRKISKKEKTGTKNVGPSSEYVEARWNEEEISSVNLSKVSLEKQQKMVDLMQKNLIRI